MAKFEFQTEKNQYADPETIEADDFMLDTVAKKLTFTDKDTNQLASYFIGPGAWVKRK